MKNPHNFFNGLLKEFAFHLNLETHAKLHDIVERIQKNADDFIQDEFRIAVRFKVLQVINELVFLSAVVVLFYATSMWNVETVYAYETRYFLIYAGGVLVCWVLSRLSANEILTVSRVVYNSLRKHHARIHESLYSEFLDVKKEIQEKKS